MPDTPEFVSHFQEYSVDFVVGDNEFEYGDIFSAWSADGFDRLRNGIGTTSDTGDNGRFYSLIENADFTYSLTLTSGSYTVSGNSVNTVKSSVLSPVSGSYTVNGNNAGIAKTYVFSVLSGSHSLNGNNLNLLKSILINANAGSYSINGNSIELTIETNSLLVTAGSYSISGNPLNLIKTSVISADVGNYAITGNSVTLSPLRVLSLVSGDYDLNGNSLTVSKYFILSLNVGGYQLRGNEIIAEATQAETFYLNLIVDLLPDRLTGNYQRFAERLTVDGNVIPIRSWTYEENAQDLAGTLQIDLARVSDRSLLTETADIVFQIGQLGIGQGWADITPTTLIDTGYLQRHDYTIGRQGISPDDRVTFSALSELDSKLNTAPSNNLVYYNPSFHNVTADDFEGIYDEEGAYTAPTVTSADLSLYNLFDLVFVDLCGFTDVQTNIPDFPLSIVEFSAGRPYTGVINGIIGMFEAVYQLIDGTLWILDGTAGNPPDFPLPRQITTSQASGLGVATEYTKADSLLLSVAQEKFIYDYWTERTETSVSTTGDLGLFPDNFIETTTETVYRDYFRLSRPSRPVKTEPRRITETQRERGLSIIYRTTEDYTYDSFGRVRTRTKTTEALLPDPTASFGNALIDVCEENEVFQYRLHPYEPRTYYLKTREINKAGLVYIDGDNQQLGEDYSRDALNAYRAGNVVDSMTSDWLKLSTYKEELTPRRNRKVKIKTTEIDYLVKPYGQITINDEEERDGDVGVNIFVIEQQKIRIPTGTPTGLMNEVNMGELPLDLALSLGYRILENQTNLPSRISCGYIGIDTTLQKGTAINAFGRNGQDLGKYVIESRRLEGSPNGYFTTLQARQSE